MNKGGYPRGKPEEDSQKIQAWWAEEMAACGLAGRVTVEHAPASEAPSTLGRGRRLVENLVLGQVRVANAHVYHAMIPGAPWPLETVVFTTAEGMVTNVLYVTQLATVVPGQVRIARKIGWIGTKLVVEGPGAAWVNGRKDLLKQCKKSLVFRYDPPPFGFLSSTGTLELGEAFLEIRPAEKGSDAAINTTPTDAAKFVGREYSLGLQRTLTLLRAIEPAL